jgi:hypothetical protein
MNEAADLLAVQTLQAKQAGVFTLADLRSTLGESHRAALFRRIDRLLNSGIIARCTNGIFVTKRFDLAVLSQRIAPDSAVSFETVLARALVIGPLPSRRVSAIRNGKSRTYAVSGAAVEHHRLHPKLRFGEEVRDGVRFTVPEKALLDVLTFHQRGRRALFDVYSDVNLDRLDRGLLRELLGRYENPRFVAFARNVLRTNSERDRTLSAGSARGSTGP